MPHYEFKHVPDTPLWRVYAIADCKCGHSWNNHAKTANGALACKHHGCGCRDVEMSDGHYRQEFTSLAAAKAWVEHQQKTDHHDFLRANARFAHEWDPATYPAPCNCYGCVTMRKPCIKEIR